VSVAISALFSGVGRVVENSGGVIGSVVKLRSNPTLVAALSSQFAVLLGFLWEPVELTEI
jgi:hypothetical protein